MSKVKRSSEREHARRGELLLRAVDNNDLAATKSLIADHAVVNQRVNGVLPLHRAVAQSRIKLVSLLIQAGADPNKPDASGESSLFAVRDFKPAVLLAAAGGDPNITSVFDMTPLMVAASNGQRKAVDALLRINAECDYRNAKGETALMFAAGNAQAGVVTQLLEWGADAKIRDVDGCTALHHAAVKPSRSACEIARLLVASGVDVNIAEKDGETALMVAAYARATNVVRTLITLGADVNLVSDRGLTPLIYATLREDILSVRLLLEAGASAGVCVPTHHPNRLIRGMTPEDLAIESRNSKLVAVLCCHRGHSKHGRKR